MLTLFGLTIARTKTLALQQKQQSSLMPLSSWGGMRGWWPWLHEVTTGGWQRNEQFSLDTVLRNPTLFACVSQISGDMGKLRPMLVEQDADGIWSEIVEGSPFLAVLDQPNGYQTWPDYAEWYITSKLLAGNVYVWKERDQRGVVRALYVLDPCKVTPLIAPDGSVFYQLSEDPLQDVMSSIVVPAREIIHDRVCPMFHPLVGISPIYAAAFPAMAGLNLRNTQDKFISNGSRPGGILMVPGTLTQPQVDEMKANWKASFSGDNQGDIALLTGGMTYVPQGTMTAEQSRIIELAHMTDEDIAKAFGIPRHKVGIGPDPTYTNIQAKNQDYLSDCLQGRHIVPFQIKHTKGLELDRVPGKRLALELDLDDLLLMDMASKADAAQKAVNSGLSYNEARLRFWDAGPVSGGGSPLAQQQYYSLAALAKRDAAADPFATNTTSVARGTTDVTPPEEPKQFDLIDAAMIRRKVQIKCLELAA